MRDHPVVGAHGEALDVPPAHHRLGRVGVGEHAGAADGFGHPRELSDGRDVADDDAARGEGGRDLVDALPGGEHVEYDPVDGAGFGDIRELFHQVADGQRPVGGRSAVESGDVAGRDIRELLTTLERQQTTGGADRTEQPERESTGTDARLDHGRTGEDVADRENSRRVFRVDDRCPPWHRHDEIVEKRAERQILVTGGAEHHARIRLPDHRIVRHHPAMRVEHRTRFESDRVEAALGAGELHSVAGAEGSALAAHRVAHAVTRVVSTAVTRVERTWRRSSTVRPSSDVQSVKAAFGSIGVCSGTTIVAAPDATADARPGTESSTATQAVISTPRNSAARR